MRDGRSGASGSRASGQTTRRGLLAFAVLMAAAQVAVAQPSGESISIPMQERGAFASREITLEATLYRPPGTGRFPVVVFSHGSTGPGVVPLDRTENPRGLGAYLLARDIALLIPMRRGRGKSGGAYTEPYDCSLQQSRHGIRYAMESLDAVFAYLRTQDWADMQRVVLAGQSRGGILSTVYAAERPESAIGVVNFAGGWMSARCNARAGTDINETIFREAGARAKAPALFLYAANDSYYAPSSIERYPAAFRDAGGRVEFHFYQLPAGANGHALFYDHWKQWTPDMDAFLRQIGIGK